jgi:FG-GAP-like repeat
VKPVRPRRGIAAAAAIATLLLAVTGAASAATQTLVGATSVRFAWAPAPGAPAGYFVLLSVNGAAPVSYSYVRTPEVVIPVTVGQVIAIQVMATGYNSAGALVGGPRSALSDPVSVVASPLFPAAAGRWLLRCSTCSGSPLASRSVANASLVQAQATGPAPPWRVLGHAKLQYGREQIIMQNSSTGQLSVYDADFLAPIASLTTFAPATLEGVGAADFDHDGMEEFVTQRSDTGVVMFWGVNAGSFEYIGTVAGPTTKSLAGLGDFNRDGKIDLLWHDSFAGTLDLWKLAKDPTLGSPLTTLLLGSVRVASGLPSNAVVASTGDYDGDGSLDVLWRYADGRLAISYLNLGLPLRYVVLTAATGDINLRVIGSVDIGGTSGEEIALQDNVTGLIWIFDPSTSGAVTRTKVLNPGSDWRVAGIGS